MAFAIGVEDGLEAEVMYLIGIIAYLLYLTWMVQLTFFRIFGYFLCVCIFGSVWVVVL